MNNQFQPPTINRDSVNTIAINIGWTVQTTHSPRTTDLSVKPFWDLTTFFGHDGVLKNTLAIMGMWIYCCNIRNGLNLQQSPKSKRFQAKSHQKSPKTANHENITSSAKFAKFALFGIWITSLSKFNFNRNLPFPDQLFAMFSCMKLMKLLI